MSRARFAHFILWVHAHVIPGAVASIVLASADDRVRLELEGQLRRAGRPYARAASWHQLVSALCHDEVRLVLVDGALPELDPELLLALGASLPHSPEIYSIGPLAPPLRPLRKLPLLLTQLATARTATGETARELRLLGLGRHTHNLLADAATSAMPVLVWGERGTGKKRIARRIHQLSGLPGPLLELPRGELPILDGPLGTLFVPGAQQQSDAQLFTLAEICRGSGWSLVASARQGRPRSLLTWQHLQLLPLRERQTDLRNLALLYLERHRRRMRLPRRRFDRPLWALMRRHRWLRNAQELEAFVVQALACCDTPVIAAAALPQRVKELIEPRADETLLAHTEGFEELVEQRLQPVVEQLEPDAQLGLYKLVIQATERALLRLALARTGGNQKSAARLLGVARNTLHTKAVRLGLRKGS